jgi:ArsR family transcriptional regulator
MRMAARRLGRRLFSVEKRTMSPELLELVANRFRMLADPTRLQILYALSGAEMTVTDLVEATGLRQANLSKHLQLLYRVGFVDRRKDGLHVYYRIADETIFRICELVCGRLKAEVTRRQTILADV